MGAADLHHIVELARLVRQGLLQVLQRGREFFADGFDDAEVDGGREHVVAGLAEVDVIVGMHGRLVAAFAAEQFVGAAGDDLVGVHVGRRARAGLENVHGELGIKLAVDHFGCRRHNRVGHFFVDQAEFEVRFCGGALDAAHGVDEPGRQRPAADREIGHRPLRLHAVIGVGGHFQRAH